MENALVDSIRNLPTFSNEGDLNVIVDTPRHSRNKYKFDEASGMFALGGVLPVGYSFPYDFGYIPNTLGGDGDPLDVLVFMDEPAFVGCLVKCRLVGVIKAEQIEGDAPAERNDRLLAVARKSLAFGDVSSLDDLNPKLTDQVEHFFVSYNHAKGKIFTPLGRFGPDEALRLIREASVTK